jgi:hypothetical protein
MEGHTMLSSILTTSAPAIAPGAMVLDRGRGTGAVEQWAEASDRDVYARFAKLARWRDLSLVTWSCTSAIAQRLLPARTVYYWLDIEAHAIA